MCVSLIIEHFVPATIHQWNEAFQATEIYWHSKKLIVSSCFILCVVSVSKKRSTQKRMSLTKPSENISQSCVIWFVLVSFLPFLPNYFILLYIEIIVLRTKSKDTWPVCRTCVCGSKKSRQSETSSRGHTGRAGFLHVDPWFHKTNEPAVFTL